MWPQYVNTPAAASSTTRLPCVRTTKYNNLNDTAALRITRVIEQCSLYFCAPGRGQRCRCPLTAAYRLHMHLLHLHMRPLFNNICHARTLFQLHSVPQSNRALFFFNLVRPVDRSQFWCLLARRRGYGVAPSKSVLVADV